jgi:transcriptional regulator with GAF, ATPase, and Fis domain
MEAFANRYDQVREAFHAGLVCWCGAAMRTANDLVGVLYLGSRRDDAFSERDLELLKQVATVSALFVGNALIHSTVAS